MRLPRIAAPVAAVLVLILAGCAEDDPAADDPNTGNGTSAPSEPTDTASEPTDSPTESSTGTEGNTVAAPVYFVGQTPMGPKLFREFRRVEADNPLEEAAALMTAGDALDPDYSTLFPGGAFESVGYSEAGQVLVARVADDSWKERPAGMSAREAKLAVQQLVYTLQGVQQERLPVVIQDDNGPTSLFGLDSAKGFKAAKPLNVLALMNVTTPEEGASVPDTFTATGVASSFEATVHWEVRDGSGTAVLDGFTTAEGWIKKLWPWKAEIDVSSLAPGTYTFAAITDDPSDGEGPGPTEDTKTIVVE